MCSTIIFGQDCAKYLAQNYDYVLDSGLIATNLRGTKKANHEPDPSRSVKWEVKYGSITFNQFSLEMPVSGMNEAGLAIALMWHDEGDFGNDDQYKRLSSLQWIQYQLDRFSSVAQVAAELDKVRPERGPVPLHYTLLDAQGDCLLVEFIDGQLVQHINPSAAILTNSSYSRCLSLVESNASDDIAASNSIARFAHLFERSSQIGEKVSPDTGFELLNAVNQTPGSDQAFPWNTHDTRTITAWSIVFNPADKSISLKTDQNHSIRTLNFHDFSFDAADHYLVADINTGKSGSIHEQFEPYSKQKNQELLSRAAPVVGLPGIVQDELATVIDSLYSNRQM